MTTTSRVLSPPPLDSREAYDHFARKLSLETDPADVYTDLKNGNADFLLVDVRSPDAYARSHAQGAINIPHAGITREKMAQYSQQQAFVVYCWGPGCNGADKAALKLSELGFAVKIMIGGIEYWEDRERYPVERG